MKAFFAHWLSLLSRDGEAAAAVLFNGSGSRPREDGARMLIDRTGGIFQTVGGGRMEAEVMASAKSVLADRSTRIEHFELTGGEAAVSDMICGGRSDVMIYYSGSQDRDVLKMLSSRPSLDGWLLFPAKGNEELSYVSADGQTAGNARATSEFLLMEKSRDISLMEIGGRQYLSQWISTPGRLHLMGAGHVSREIAKVAAIAGIECIVYDDRPEFANAERFPGAQCVLVENMSRPPETAVGAKDMIAIVTRGHMFDMENLAWALQTEAGYIGMIGSRKKSASILARMLEKGYPESRVRGVCAPIGLDIGAQTPAEIAVAVVAQLIQFRRGRLHGG